MLGDARVGTCDDHAIVRILRPTGPELLPGKHPVVTIPEGLEADAGKVRSRSGLGEKLAPDLLAFERGVREALAEFLIGIFEHHRNRLAKADAEIGGAEAEFSFLFGEDRLLEFGSAPAAIGFGPGNAGIAAVVFEALPAAAECEVIGFAQPAAGLDPVFGGVAGEPRAGGRAIGVEIGHHAASRCVAMRSSQNQGAPASAAMLRERR